MTRLSDWKRSWLFNVRSIILVQTAGNWVKSLKMYSATNQGREYNQLHQWLVAAACLLLSTRKNKVFSRFSENNHVFERDFVLLCWWIKQQNYYIWGEVLSALVGFHAGLLFWSNWNLDMLGFVEERKSENPKKKPLEQAGREQTTNTTQIRHQAGVEPRPH